MEIDAPIRPADHVKSPGALKVKAQVHQIVWHSQTLKSTPVFSVSLCPRNFDGKYLLASGGANKMVMLWAVTLVEDAEQDVKTQVAFLKALENHSSSVNCVRFSPDGHLMASGSDGGEVCLWRHRDEDDLSGWKCTDVMRGHTTGGDVFDLCWSPDGNVLLSTSVNKEVVVWDMSKVVQGLKGTKLQVITDHHAFVQGVAWDPMNRVFVTQSSDKTCRVYSQKKRARKLGDEYHCTHVIQKASIDDEYTVAGELFINSSETDPNDASPKSSLFLDDSSSIFFRRLTFTPKGEFLVIPAGVIKKGPDDAGTPTTWVYKTPDFKRPFASLPSHKGTTSACASPDGKILAVSDIDGSIFIYSAAQLRCIAAIGGLHLAPITDLSFSHDSSLLAASSQDGYVSFVILQS